MIDYGISTGLLKGRGLDEVIRAIAEAGFRQIEILAGGDEYDAWFQEPARTQRALRGAGITATSVHSPQEGWHTAASDSQVRQTVVEIVSDCFHRAAEVGARTVVVHPNSTLEPFTSDEFAASWARTREALTLLAESAQRAGVMMLVENMPARGKPRPGSSVGEVLKMIDGLGDHVGICLDVGHSHANGLDPTEEMRVAGDKLQEIHLQDNDGGGEDQHWIMGAGSIDWRAYRQTVAALGFDGFQVFEVVHGDTPMALLADLAEVRRRWRAGQR